MEKVARSMADRESAVRRHISRAKAGATEGTAHNHTCTKQFFDYAAAHKAQVHGLTGWIHAECKCGGACGFAPYNICHGGDVLKHAPGTTRDDRLIHI
ncbi:MAG: hypothetical protein DDT38_01415 [Firmicutes bacterium]|nr:hypothetical protein [candidate division NPL-UPA2 bacterium]